MTTSRTRIRWLRVAVLLTVLLVLLAASCGKGSTPTGSPGSEPTGSESAATTAQGITKDTILIGTFAPFSGQASLYGAIDAGVHAVFQKVNEEGGINGRQVKIVTLDDECKDTTTKAVVQRLVYQEKVFMIIGGNCSNAVLAARPDIIAAGIPFIGQGAVADGIYSPLARNIFAAVQTSKTIAPDMVRFALSKPGVKRVAIVKQTDDWGMAQYEAAIEKLKSSNVEIVADVDVADASVQDMSPQVLQVKNSNPDFVIAILYPQPMSVFLRDRVNLGLSLDIPVVERGAEPADLLEMLGNDPKPLTNYFANYSFTKPVTDPAFDPWREELKKYDPTLDLNSSLPYLAIPGALAAAEALRNAGQNPTWDSFIDAMEHIHGLETGFTAPLSYSHDNHYGLTGGGYEVRAPDGKFIVVTDWQGYEDYVKSH